MDSIESIELRLLSSCPIWPSWCRFCNVFSFPNGLGVLSQLVTLLTHQLIVFVSSSLYSCSRENQSAVVFSHLGINFESTLEAIGMLPCKWSYHFECYVVVFCYVDFVKPVYVDSESVQTIICAPFQNRLYVSATTQSSSIRHSTNWFSNYVVFSTTW